MPEDIFEPEKRAAILREMYARLMAAYGPQQWWPAETATEVVIGAILTQNTAWTNVERAIVNMRAADCLLWPRIHDLAEVELAEIIKPCGTYRVKARRLKAFVGVLFERHDGSLNSLLGGSLSSARERLLAIKGVGEETADAILLYASERPTFVVDTYTRRVLRRHFLVDAQARYETVQGVFHDALADDAPTFNEYHALLVAVGKQHCGVHARCDGCPLVDLPHDENV